MCKILAKNSPPCLTFLFRSLVFFEGCEYIFEPLIEFDHVGSRDVRHVLKFFHSNVHCLHLCNVLLEISFQCLQEDCKIVAC